MESSFITSALENSLFPGEESAPNFETEAPNGNVLLPPAPVIVLNSVDRPAVRQPNLSTIFTIPEIDELLTKLLPVKLFRYVLVLYSIFLVFDHLKEIHSGFFCQLKNLS